MMNAASEILWYVWYIEGSCFYSILHQQENVDKLLWLIFFFDKKISQEIFSRNIYYVLNDINILRNNYISLNQNHEYCQ